MAMRRASVFAALLLTTSPLWAQEKPAAAPAADGAFSPTRVTVSLEGVSAEEALTELGKIGGLDFHTDNPNGWGQTDLVIFDAKDRPYWPAVLEVCRQAKVNIDLYMYNRQRQVRTWPGQDLQIDRMPFCEVGSSLLVLQGESRTYSLGFQSPAQVNTQLYINGVLLLDPKLHLASSVIPKISTAVDENGVSLLRPGQDSSSYYGSEAGSLFLHTNLALTYPPNAGRKIARLAGVLKMSAVIKEELWEIKDILSAKSQTHAIAGGNITIKSLQTRNQGEGYELKFTMPRKKNRDGRQYQEEYQATWSMVQTIELLTAEGTRFNFGGGGGGDEWTVYFNPPSPGAKPATLKWSLPLEIKEIEAPFEFKDLPIT